MFILDLDNKSPTPLYRQIIDRLRRLIESGALRVGERLPSTRRLAEQLGLHRSTVSTAYQELWSLGYIEMRPGSRPCVRARLSIAPAGGREARGILDWERLSSGSARGIFADYRHFGSESASAGASGPIDPFADATPPRRRGLKSEPRLSIPMNRKRFMSAGFMPGSRGVDMASLDIDGRLLPLDQYRACLNRALRTYGPDLLAYGAPHGFRPLREYIAGRMNAHGVAATADEILITNGATHGIDLVLRLIAAPGRTVVVESPTYRQVLPLLRFHGFKEIEVPMRAGGMDLDALAAVLKNHQPALVYTMPTFHNPTGTSTGQAHRERLLSLCGRARVPILEDGFEEEMKYFGKIVLPLKSMDRDRVVIYAGTFSKVLFPGLRLGWITADRDCVDRLAALRRSSELSPNLILQAGLYEFCRRGYYDLHVQRMHRIFRKRMTTTLRLLKRMIPPAWAEWREPNGGYLVWLKLKPAGSRGPDWARLFTEHGVTIVPGRHFYRSGGDHSHIRLSISTLNEDEIGEAIRRIAKALSGIHRRKSHSRRLQ